MAREGARLNEARRRIGRLTSKRKGNDSLEEREGMELVRSKE